MKKEKGFTLIELLAVIVILAIIALIAIPIVLNIIETAKKGSARISAISYIKEVNRLNALTIENQFHGEISDITESEWLKNVELSGTMPSSGYLTIDETGIVSVANLCVNDYNVSYENKKAKVTGKCTPKRGEFDVLDSTPGDLNCQIIDEIRTCYIESIEDLVAFSDMANGINGKKFDNFENTKIMLMNSLDFDNNLSYVNSDKQWGYDINGNGKIESLKDELTKDSGFMPISSSSNAVFKGTFDGNGYTIKNININRSTSNYVAMFGYNEGIIRGLNIKNINVTGNQYVAGLVASNKGIVSMINLEGNISGTYAGGIVSQGNYSSATVKDVIMNGTVTGTGSSGIAYNSTKIYGIVESGEYFNSLSNSGSSVKIGYIDGKVTAKSYSNVEKMLKSTFNKLNAYNNYVQTLVEGTDINGYYFDYNKDKSDIIVKHISSNPINNILKGSGTKDDPYLIYTTDDMRKISNQNTNGKYYSLKSNLDYKNNQYYMIGTSKNPFKGTFDGNGYTISNITIDGNNYVAMFGYNEGEIRGLNIKKINVTGSQYVAGLVAQNKGTVSMINLEGNISGTYAGGIVSQGNYSSATVKDVIMNGTVTGTGSSGIAYNSTKIYGIVESGEYFNSLSNGGSSVKIGYIDGKVTAKSYSNVQKMLKSTFNKLNAYNNYVQTLVEGPDINGYYFDYNKDKSDIIVKHISSNPINNILKGSGTKDDPYLIYTTDDMRKISNQNTNGKYYSLKSNLDYKNNQYYMIGTSKNPFKGTFDGNGYTISNITIDGNNYVAMFGYNEGEIRGLNIKKINVTGSQYVAGLVAQNKGTISMINLEGNISGTYAGGIVSQGNYSSATVKDVIMNGTVTGTGSSGIAYNSTKIYGIVESGEYFNSLSNGGSSVKIGYIDGKVTAKSYSNVQKMSETSYNDLNAYGKYIKVTISNVDDSGYYFGYNSDSTDIIVKKVNS